MAGGERGRKQVNIVVKLVGEWLVVITRVITTNCLNLCVLVQIHPLGLSSINLWPDIQLWSHGLFARKIKQFPKIL